MAYSGSPGVSMAVNRASEKEIEDMLRTELDGKRVSSFSRKVIRSFSTGNYLIKDRNDDRRLGILSIIDYPEAENSRELCIFTKYAWKNADYKDLIADTLNRLRKEHDIEYLYLRISEGNTELKTSVEDMGFMRNGIYITNHNADREFSSYTLYRYGLNEDA